MTVARLYANENFAFPVVEALRRLGHEVQTTAAAGQAGQAISDEAVLDFAVQESRAILTLNRRHFVQLHAERPAHQGIIVCSFDTDFDGLARRIDLAIKSAWPIEEKLIRVNRPD